MQDTISAVQSARSQVLAAPDCLLPGLVELGSLLQLTTFMSQNATFAIESKQFASEDEKKSILYHSAGSSHCQSNAAIHGGPEGSI